MIITRSPLRISFFGGGTDYPAWFESSGGGSVLSTSIDKYCHISARFLPQFFDHRSRIAYSKVELVNSVDEIEHPVVRHALNFVGIKDGVEIHNFDDLPARSGMGSSSSFTVGLLHALSALKGERVSRERLAKDAIHIEQNLLRENVGCQDQVAAAYGGLNKISFGGKEKIKIEPIILSDARKKFFQDHLMLFFTGRSRYASEIAAEQVKNTPQKSNELKAMLTMVDDAVKVLQGGDLNDFGKMLHETWQLKRSLSSKITNSLIDEAYDAGRGAGASGGKLLGAGGGGFLLFFANPELHGRIKTSLSKLLHIPFSFENDGSQIIYEQKKHPQLA
ncbi:MAG: kinase [Candidatus Liptonbacteria bacterium]|nr:kinase [Candidatus Liptonbacteria bacterium]